MDDIGSKGRQALCYARKGWPVFPLIPGEKIPVTAHGFKDATTDEQQIRRWWQANPDRNIGIATGAPGPDVIDVDHHGEDANGFGSWAQIKRAGLVDGPGALVRTPSGGFHAYYRGTAQGNGSLKGKYIDFRSCGGYVVAPGSEINGKPYEVVAHRPGSATVDWKAIRLTLVPETPRPRPGRQLPDGDGDVTLERVASWADGRQEHDRNFPLYWAAKTAMNAGADPDVIVPRLMISAQRNGLAGGPREALRTIESGIRDGRR